MAGVVKRLFGSPVRACLLFAVSVACVPVSLCAERTKAQGQEPLDLLVRNVRIVHGDGRVTARAHVGMRGGLIVSIDTVRAQAQHDGEAPARRVIDGSNRTLIPGLIDAHVHLEPWVLRLLLEYGVTTVRDLHNTAAYIYPLAAADDAGRSRVVASGPMFDGPGGDPLTSTVVTTVGDARSAVRRQIEEGARVITVSPRIEPAIFSVIASEARARGIPVAAHLGATTATQAADAGVSSIEHLSGVAEAASVEGARLARIYADFFGGWTAAQIEWTHIPMPRFVEVARDLVAKGVVMVPTLVAHLAVSRLADPDIGRDPDLAEVPADVLNGPWNPSTVMARERWTPQVLTQFKQTFPVLEQFVGIYARAGGRVAAGSGLGQAFVAPGAGLHRELELLVACGLSHAQALRAATADAAALLGLKDRVGTIEVGKAADAVLLDGDPLTDIRNTRRIRAVIKDGVLVQTSEAR